MCKTHSWSNSQTWTCGGRQRDTHRQTMQTAPSDRHQSMEWKIKLQIIFNSTLPLRFPQLRWLTECRSSFNVIVTPPCHTSAAAAASFRIGICRDAWDQNPLISDSRNILNHPSIHQLSPNAKFLLFCARTPPSSHPPPPPPRVQSTTRVITYSSVSDVVSKSKTICKSKCLQSHYLLMTDKRSDPGKFIFSLSLLLPRLFVVTFERSIRSCDWWGPVWEVAAWWSSLTRPINHVRWFGHHNTISSLSPPPWLPAKESPPTDHHIHCLELRHHHPRGHFEFITLQILIERGRSSIKSGTWSVKYRAVNRGMDGRG